MVKRSIALDSNVAIDFLNGKPETLKFLTNYASLYLPVTVCGELLYGALNSTRHEENYPKFKKFIESCHILHPNIVVAEEYAHIRQELKLKGTPIPENDIWIASICVVFEIPLASNDYHFANIKQLQLIKF
jgi:tRNA(fMet)-specific endonuclease VapC